MTENKKPGDSISENYIVFTFDQTDVLVRVFGRKGSSYCPSHEDVARMQIAADKYRESEDNSGPDPITAVRRALAGAGYTNYDIPYHGLICRVEL